MAVELRAAAPALDLRLLRNGRLAAFVLAAFTLGAGFLSIFVALSAYQQGGLGASSMQIIVVGTGASLLLARGRRTEHVAVPVPQPTGAG